MSGTGKSSALAELARRGFRTVDTDEPGWMVEAELGWDERAGWLRRTATIAARNTASVAASTACFAFAARFRAAAILDPEGSMPPWNRRRLSTA